jgi:hypothetical protein
MSSNSIYTNEIFRKRKITDYLASKGIFPQKEHGNRKLYRCPVHQGDTSPSMTVFTDSEYENYYCFGCIEENELIWTSSGLKKIIDIQTGDKVLDIHGNFSRVGRTKISEKNISSIKLECCSDPLYLTPDHTCLYLSKEDVGENLPYIKKYKNSFVFSNKDKQRKRGKKYRDKLEFLEFRENNLKDIKEGDFFVFPVIDERKRVNKDLVKLSILKEYTKGPKNKRIKGFKANKNSAFIIGIWLAEGSICSEGRVVRWTFNINEKHIAEKLSNALYSEFQLKSQIREYPKKNTCELDCCNVDLAKQFKYWFNTGSSNKDIPISILNWEGELQSILIESFVLGDGCKSGRQCYTVSQKLAYSLFCLSIQSGRYPYLTPRQSRVDKKGVSHKKSYCIGFSSKERMNGFYETIKGVKYYIAKIKEIQHYSKKKKVVDIEVEGSHSFVTKLGAVHNCHSGTTIINLVSDMENINTREAFKILITGLEISGSKALDDFSTDYDEFVKAGSYDDINSIIDIEALSLRISVECYNFLKSNTDFDSGEIEFFEKVLQKVDTLTRAKNKKDLEKIFSFLVEIGIPYRAEVFYDRQEQKIIEESSEIEVWRSI